MKKITLSGKLQLYLMSMSEHLGKYILRRKLSPVVLISLSPVVEGLTVDEERKINNKSKQKITGIQYIFSLEIQCYWKNGC